jgi:type II secretory pathway component PulM
MSTGTSAPSGLGAAFANMSERERRLVTLLIAAFTLIVLAGGLWWATSKLDGRERRVRDMRQNLQQILALEAQYKSAEQTEKKSASRLRTNNTSLFSLLQKSAGALGLTLNDLNERKTPVRDTEVTEVSVEVNLKKVSIDKLNTFLEKVEGKRSSGLVKVKKLKVKSRYDDPELLDVNMTVVTWKAS